MKKKIAILLAIILLVVGIAYIIDKNKDVITEKSGGFRTKALSTHTEEEIKKDVDREVARGKISNLADLELIEKLYPTEPSYKLALFDTYYNQDPNKGLKYGGEVYMSTGNKDILELVSQKTNIPINYSADKRFETLRSTAEEAARSFFGTWKDIFVNTYVNDEAPFYLKNAIQAKLMVSDLEDLYVLTYGGTPFQKSISQGEKINGNESEIYKIDQEGKITYIAKFLNGEDNFREILFKEDSQGGKFMQASSFVVLEDEIAFKGMSIDDVAKVNTEILNDLEHNSITFDWKGYENLAPFAKLYFEEILKVKNSALPNIRNDREEEVIKKSFIVDLDNDGVLELVLLVNNVSQGSRTNTVIVDTYSNNKVERIFEYTDFAQDGTGYSLNIDAGILNENGNKYLYIAHTGNSGFVANTNIGILSKAKGQNQIYQEEGYSNVAFVDYLSPNGETNEYEEAKFVSDSRYIKPNVGVDFKEGYYELSERIFGEDNNLFLTDARAKVNLKKLKDGESGVEDFKLPATDERGNIIYDGYDYLALSEKQIISLLLIPTQQAVDVPIIRRFRLNDRIFPADVLKIRADSTGHINSSILKDEKSINMSLEGNQLKIVKNGKEFLVKYPMKDALNNVYIPFTTLKDMGAIKKDLGYIVDLDFTGEFDNEIKASQIADIKADVDSEIKRGQIDSLSNLELISTIYDDSIYKEKRIEEYHKESTNKALMYSKDFFKESGNPVFLSGLYTIDVTKFSNDDYSAIDYLNSFDYVDEVSKAYVKKLLDIENEISNSSKNSDYDNFIESAFVYDFDKDGVEEIILKVSKKDEILILAYSYDTKADEIKKILSQSISKKANQKIECGIYEDVAKTYLYIVEDHDGKLPQTSISIFEKADKKFEKLESYFKAMVDRNKKTFVYSNKEIDGNYLKENQSEFEKDFKDLRKNIFGDKNVYFYSDGDPTDVDFSMYPNKFKLSRDDIFRYLLVPNDASIRTAVIRRFIIGEGIYPAEVLKINSDSKGYINPLILNDVENILVRLEENKIVIENSNDINEVTDTITDDFGRVYIPLEVIKKLGLVKEDKGNLIKLGN